MNIAVIDTNVLIDCFRHGGGAADDVQVPPGDGIVGPGQNGADLHSSTPLRRTKNT